MPRGGEASGLLCIASSIPSQRLRDLEVHCARSEGSVGAKELRIKAPKPEELDMSSTQVRSETAIETPRARRVDMKLEVVVIPVSDVDRAKRFYSNLGWRLDADFVRGDAFRVVQFTPPGSSCSIHFGTGITSAMPSSAIAVSTSAKCSTVPSAKAPSAAQIRRGAVTTRTPRSAIRTATNGCCRRSLCDCPDAWTR